MMHVHTSFTSCNLVANFAIVAISELEDNVYLS
jgi:hypothetical protein